MRKVSEVDGARHAWGGLLTAHSGILVDGVSWASAAAARARVTAINFMAKERKIEGVQVVAA